MYTVTTVQVLSADGTQEVGKISKKWSGLAKEFFTDADNFGVQCKLAFTLHLMQHTHLYVYSKL